MKALILCLSLFSFVTQAQARDTQTVKELVAQIANYFDYGRHNTTKVPQSENPLEMVKAYIKISHDEELASEFTFVSDAEQLEMDTQIAGTLSLMAASGALNDGVDYVTDFAVRFEDMTQDQVAAQKAKLQAAFNQLKKMPGVSFGFDGFEQHGCAAPTPFLLVLDSQASIVYGLDLNPCSESKKRD